MTEIPAYAVCVGVNCMNSTTYLTFSSKRIYNRDVKMTAVLYTMVSRAKLCVDGLPHAVPMDAARPL